MIFNEMTIVFVTYRINCSSIRDIMLKPNLSEKTIYIYIYICKQVNIYVKKQVLNNLNDYLDINDAY